MCKFQDYAQPLFSNYDFNTYLKLAKHVFNPQWRFLASLQGITPDKGDPALISYKERRVCSQLLTLQCVANYKELPHWALIHTTSIYAHGGCAVVVNLSLFTEQPSAQRFTTASFCS